MRIPISTYRVQFGPGFGFRDACALVPYLSELGVTDFYSSPIFKARSGSTSGYDVTDPLRLNPQLGTEEDFQALVDALRHYDIGLLLDIVPNHMAAYAENPWWRDVLENGPSSPYAAYFDIDWDPTSRTHEDRLLRPVLGAPFGAVLENQELSLAAEENGFVIRYYERSFPVDPKTYSVILARCHNDSGSHDVGMLGLQELVRLEELVDHLPPATATEPQHIEQRRHDAEILKRRLWSLYQTNTEFRALLDRSIAVFNGVKGDPRSFDLLEDLLARQPYALSYWRVAREKVNYRRFFDISDLVGVRMEDPEVFESTHALIFQLIREGQVSGLRIDHVDGLYDPLDYLTRLQSRVPETYLVVEKILHDDEKVDPMWPVAGTTGYDFLSLLNAVFTDPGGLESLGTVYARFTGLRMSFGDVLYEQKQRVIDQLFAGEAFSLGLQLGLLADQDRHARDLSPTELRQALVDVTACLPVYRTYIRSPEVSGADRRYLQVALCEAARRNPRIDRTVFDFLHRVLLLEFPPTLPSTASGAWLRFIERWQQFTGPAMAKGLEDTTFYIYHRLISVNDVGGPRDPLSQEDFHQAQQTRREDWPFTLNATSTHDTKRSEDVRARITVLSELPEAWSMHLSRWRNLNTRAKPTLNGKPVPDSNEEMLLYQTLLGAWPLDPAEVQCFRERLRAYMVKAMREAKVHTSWMSPDQAYEDAAVRFMRAILEPSADNRFLDDFLLFHKRIARYGALVSLSQVLLRLTSPGVPDTYQGTELWDFSLVDPDNRRAVDYARRRKLLEESESRTPAELLESWEDGAIKIYLIRKVLAFRRAHPDMFLGGDYIPLYAMGARAQHVLAFARRHDPGWAVVVAPRLLARLSPAGNLPMGGWIWRGTALRLPEEAPRYWTNLLTGETLDVDHDRDLLLRDVLRRFPLALLRAIPEPAAEPIEAGEVQELEQELAS